MFDLITISQNLKGKMTANTSINLNSRDFIIWKHPFLYNLGIDPSVKNLLRRRT